MMNEHNTHSYLSLIILDEIISSLLIAHASNHFFSYSVIIKSLRNHLTIVVHGCLYESKNATT